MGDVTYFNGITRLPVPVGRVLDSAKEAGLKEVIVAGVDEGGNEVFFSSEPDGPSILWILERTKKALLEVVDGDEE